MFYRQCIFRLGETTTIGWIPEENAKVGNQVTLKGVGGELDWWHIIEVSDQRIPEEVAKRQERDSERFKRGGSLANQ